MVVRMRVTKGHRNNRRSHHGLKMPRLSKCANCGAWHKPHCVCPECGQYRGRMVVDVVAKQAKKLAKRQAKAEALGLTGAPEVTENTTEETVENKVADK